MKENKKDIKDLIIKIVLIIIIILLLVHNCVLASKKKGAKTPSGNVNIIEITCVDSSKCDISDKKKNDTTYNEDDVNVAEDGVGGVYSNNNQSSRSSRNSSGSNINGNSSNSSSSGNGETTTTDTVVEPDDELFVRDKKLVWNDSSDLKIFTNSVYTFEGKIAPEASNTYQFVVKNSTSYKVKYNISFMENNPYSINMKYKLKKNNTYVVDHYVSFNELNVSDQLLNANNNDTFYLEWKWVSSDNDNNAGENGANYSLKIDVNAESVD
ncbi:MAG: hypothetical protein VZS44_06305 [Bacilli bacterium]|nr:hypothetical protein [Bacilli bacterium]